MSQDSIVVMHSDEMAANAWEIRDGVLWVGRGSDLGVVKFEMNLTGSDQRFLKSLRIAYSSNSA